VVGQDGAVVFLEGLGVREKDRPEAMTPDTLMRIGSVTKSVTATLAATLVDAGLVDWDTRAVDLLPGFALSDPTVTERVTLADLFSAATGLPRRDAELIFQSDHYSPAGLIEAARRLPLTAPLGERYQYSNQAFGLGGYAAAMADGAAPNDLLAGYFAAVQHRVLNPIGMERSTFALQEVLASGDYAEPHAPDLNGTPRSISLLGEDRFTMAVAPAGAMWSTARDMAKYLQTQLAEGVAPDGTRVVSAENLGRTWKPGVVVPPNPQLPLIVSNGLERYGLGWYIGEYGSLELISHSGGSFGFSAEMAFLPEADLGIVVLANDSVCGAMLAFATQYRLFEIVFDQEPATAAEFAAFVESVAAQRAAARALIGDVDPAVVAPVLGRYEDPELGEIELRMRGGDLIVDAGEVRSHLAPLRGLPGQPVRYIGIDPPLSGAPAWFTFEAGTDGRMRPVLTVMAEPGEEPLVYPFTPLAAPGAMAPATPAA
jgi:CubicO group peptidase (beta-lactamase class C family)